MKKALASVVVIVFAGLLSTSLLTVFSGNSATSYNNNNAHVLEYPYYMSY